jgi:predicted ThiF/HesA family dinucleotide-utilizing enzyme
MKSIVIIGVGALGSHVVQLLRNLEAKIRVVDFDKIERKNVASQFHTVVHVGKSKTFAIQQTMRFLFGVEIEVIPHKLTKDNDEQLLGKADLIVDCLDNREARRIVQDFARRDQVPCLHGALAADGVFGRVVWDEFFTIDDEGGPGKPTCEGGEHLPFIAIVSAYLARSAQVFLGTGKKVGYQVTPGGVFSA